MLCSYPVRTFRTLVVEDNTINLTVALGLLAKLGHPAEAAPSGERAMVLFEPGKYDAILMDCHMPGMDGYETTAQIRRRELEAHYPGVHIIALTADVREGVRERCLAAGMNDYLTKPVSLARLQSTLENIPEEVPPSPPAATPVSGSRSSRTLSGHSAPSLFGLFNRELSRVFTHFRRRHVAH